MKVTQISIYLGNKEGMLQKVSQLLGKSNINMRAITIAESEGIGVLRIIVDKPNDAMKVLKTNSFIAQPRDVLAIEVDDRPGGLASILQTFSENKLNIEFMYGFIEKFCGKALLAVSFDDIDRAESVLKNYTSE